MPPKGKKGKKAQDTSWEDDMDAIAAETTGVNPKAEPTEAAPVEEAPVEVSKAPLEVDPEEEFGGGGLMGALRKQKKKKGGKAQDEEPAAATPEAAESPAADKDDDDEETGGRVMTKKEKEKAKKEREKQRKKEQAAKKKGGAPAAAPAKAEPKKGDVVVEAPKAAPAKEVKGKKGKVPSAAILALQKQQEALRKREEEIKRLEEEERKAAEEEERLLREEEKRKEEAKARKKEKEREKKEQLKKEGKYLTKAQKEEQAKNQLRLKQMMEAGGLKVAALEADAKDKPKKRPVYDNRKKKKVDPAKLKEQEEMARIEEARRKDEERIAAEKKEKEAAKAKQAEEDAKAAAAAAAAAATAPAAEDSDEDDWEAQLAKEEAAAAAAAAAAVKDSWDDESDDEAPAPAAAPAKPAAPAKKEEESDSEDDDSDDSDDSEYERLTAARKQAQIRKEEASKRRQAALAEAKKNANADDLRSPICCILGHVDTGKTKLLDKIRQTNVQEGEAGGITQQIGATYFPVEAIKTKTAVVNQDNKLDFKIPGLLIIDTPGHESFTNLRSRGSSLCNIAILVIDIMHGLEPQTKESIKLLRDRKTPFIVALNKIDRLYDWSPVPNNGFQDSLSRQKKAVNNEFRDRLAKTKLELMEEGLNSELFYDNKNMAKYVSLVPTSAHTGEGIPDLLKLLVSLTQERMAGKLMYISSLEATILEVKAIEGHGTTIDVILSNGILREGDRIVLCGLNGAICTNVRALLTPQPMRELRVKSAYVHHKEVKAALGVKIAANGLEDAIAGSRLLVCGPDDDEEDLEDEVMADLEALTSKISTTGKGVAVQASTLGSLEALLEFLRTSKIPVSSISIGPVYRRDVMRVVPMLEKHKEFAVMLCFDVKVDKEAQAYADEMGIKLFTADIIYHLFDSFTAYQKDMLALRRKEAADSAVFPCVLRPVQVFNKKDPIVVGVDVIEGSLRIGTPIAAVRTKPDGEKEVIVLGRVTSIRLQETNLQIVKKGHPSVAVKIEGPNQPLYGRHLDEKDILYAHISRKTIDTLKNHFREEVGKDDWGLIVQLKKVFAIS